MTVLMLITVWSVVFPLQPVYQRFGRRMPNDTFRSYVRSETQLIKTGEFTIIYLEQSSD